MSIPHGHTHPSVPYAHHGSPVRSAQAPSLPSKSPLHPLVSSGLMPRDLHMCTCTHMTLRAHGLSWCLWVSHIYRLMATLVLGSQATYFCWLVQLDNSLQWHIVVWTLTCWGCWHPRHKALCNLWFKSSCWHLDVNTHSCMQKRVPLHQANRDGH